MKTLYALTLVTALVLAGCQDGLNNVDAELDGPEAPGAASEAAYGRGTAVYEVTILNRSEGQPLTPPLAVTHSPAADLFEVGEKASFGIKEIAENGNLEPLIEALSDSPEIGDLVVAVAGDIPPVLPGQEVRFEITSPPGKRLFSFASMLVCTNDGFTGVDSKQLPRRVGDVVGMQLFGYDAGTEINTEDFADIVPPCQGLVGVTSDDEGTGMSNPDLAENGYIRHHPNVMGGNDLVEDIHGWHDPIAKIRIRRIK